MLVIREALLEVIGKAAVVHDSTVQTRLSLGSNARGRSFYARHRCGTPRSVRSLTARACPHSALPVHYGRTASRPIRPHALRCASLVVAGPSEIPLSRR